MSTKEQPTSGLDPEGYLRRIGYTGAADPTLEALETLIAAHNRTIPFENLDPLLGTPVYDLSAPALTDKLVRRRRGGYCYEQNGLMGYVLRELGFRVDGSVSALHSPCDHCGYPTRYKQFPVVCKCTTPDRCPHPPFYVIGRFCRRCRGHLANTRKESSRPAQEHIAEIQAEQVARDAARNLPTGPGLRIADRYAAGRKGPPNDDPRRVGGDDPSRRFKGATSGSASASKRHAPQLCYGGVFVVVDALAITLAPGE